MQNGNGHDDDDADKTPPEPIPVPISLRSIEIKLALAAATQHLQAALRDSEEFAHILDDGDGAFSDEELYRLEYKAGDVAEHWHRVRRHIEEVRRSVRGRR